MTTSRLAFGVCLLLGAIDSDVACGQSYVGTFGNREGSVQVRLTQERNDYVGILQAMGGQVFLRGRVDGDSLTGYLYGPRPVAFSARYANTVLVLHANGVSEMLVRLSPRHGLESVDFSGLFSRADVPDSGDAFLNAPRDGGAGVGTTPPSARSGASSTAAPGTPRSRYPELRGMIAGSQLVSFTRTSYVSDAVASSMTYVNFCTDGRFSITTDGSFSVEGNTGGNAHGASRGRQSGRWQIVDARGAPAVELRFQDGSTSVNPINAQRLASGRWRVGNTQYALQRGKVRC